MTARSRTFKDVNVPGYFEGTSITGVYSKSGPYPMVRELDTLDDVVNKNYKKRSARGEVFNNPCYRVKHSYIENGGSYNYRNVQNKSASYSGTVLAHIKSSGTSSGYPVLQDVDYERLKRLAQNRCLAKVDKTSFNFGEDLGEMRKTLTSLKSIGTDFVDIATMFKRQVHRAGIKELRGKTALDNVIKSHDAVAKAWLKARYEYRPLIISMGNLMSIYQDALDGMASKIGGRVTAVENGNVKQSFTYLHKNGHTFTIKGDNNIEYKSKAYIVYRSTIQNSVQRELGLGLKDLVPTMWALVPYSFIIDRFIDVTSMVKGAQNAYDPRINFIAAGLSTTRKHTYTEEIQSVSPLSGFTFSSCSGKQERVYESHYRHPMLIEDFSIAPVLTLKQDWETLVDVYAIFGKKLRWWEKPIPWHIKEQRR